MDELEIIKRKIKLKKQAVVLIAQEIRELQQKFAILLIKQEYEAMVGTDFDELFSCHQLEDNPCQHNHR